MFGSGPSEEITVEAKQARMEKPAHPHDSQAEYEAKLDRQPPAEDDARGPVAKLKRWFSDRF